ncbi:MAG: c-type cytochrome [Candidatus Cyclobacteriaceae bacterium M2_1C_046]
MKKVIFLTLTAIVSAVFGGVVYVKTAMPNIPVKEVKVVSNEAILARGEYLANHVMICMDCHGTRDWTKFSGPMLQEAHGKGGEIFDQSFGFPGRYVSANITPFNLHNWTDGEIYRAITSGVKKNGDAIFPVMPYVHYGKLDEEDIMAVIAYVRSLQPIEFTPEASVSDFPMNFIINTIPQPAQNNKRPLKEELIAYGEYMVTAGACIDCHTPFEKGALVMEKAFAGGREFPFPDGSKIISANLTPDKLTGLGNWTEEMFVARFKAYDLSHYVPGDIKPGEFQTMMPWTMYAGMDTTDLKAIYAYLQSLKPIENQIIRFVPSKELKASL